VAQRRRRILPDEEQWLLDAAAGLRDGAGVRLQWLIIAAIETGCRRGELLAVQWSDVNLPKRTLLVRAVEQGARKTKHSRLLPVSARLAAVLDMAKVDPAGREYPSSAFVFGALGEQVGNPKKAWETCVLRAHGHEPAWVRRGTLSEASRTALAAIDLHFHDLRHEAGCRWLEQGWPIHHVQEMLGHANLSQTSTYLHASEMGLQDSMRRFEAPRGKSVAKEAPTEHPSLGHENSEESEKGTLH
jgi:integrase